ncbi:MAG: hypothetical protein LUQ50_07705 [Methanospirillum sp.]|uniref:hypothetical protein n=1 Tax=Methanospirillum sp. TaxID=45200 RepID=UPI002370CD30|nr:hypothetical protein [Methanospirillum sp.]MDD1728940.1 hypothetical protein [Methanospirillum sp.]
MLLLVSQSCIAEISIGTVIDTVGMAHDQTMISQQYGNPVINGSASLFRDSTMTNGGDLKLVKTVSSGGESAEKQMIEAQKVLSYDAGSTGSHLAASEEMITTTAHAADDNASALCVLASGDSSQANTSFTASASLDIASATTLQMATRTRISTSDLQYAVSANTSQPGGNRSNPALITTTFRYGTETADEMNLVSDRSKIAGLFDLFNRVYHAGEEATIQAETQGSGMVTAKTIAEHNYAPKNTTGQVEWTGSTVYASTLLTNGGDLDETRTLAADNDLTSQRVVNYHANGSNSMQSEERLVVVKKVLSGLNTSSDPSCVFGGQSSDSNVTNIPVQSVSASSQVMGVDSAQIVSRASMDIGSDNNGTSPVVVRYQADVTSPVQFDATILQRMTDPDKDGRFEDLNGNGRQDMQDLVLLFKNFEWLSKSSISTRFDYNSNGRVDLADLTFAFKQVRQK